MADVMTLGTVKRGHYISLTSLLLVILGQQLCVSVVGDHNLPNGCFIEKGDLAFDSDSDLEVKCVNASLTAIPDDLPARVTALHIEGNTIHTVTRIPYTSLKVLNLAKNHIEVLQGQPFKDLENLTSLSLAYNKLTFIGNSSFEGLKSLTMLNLVDNPLGQLNDSLFISQDLPRLEILDLGNCSISHVSNNTFNLRSLQRLDLSGNRLHSSLSFFAHCNMPNLQHLVLANCGIDDPEGSPFSDLQIISLNLAGNQIERLTKEMLDGLVDLRELYLESNDLDYIHPTTLLHLHSLVELDLSHNRLVTLSEDWLPKSLTKLVLHHNLWRCDCTISWMQYNRMVQESNYNQSFKCHSPAVLANQPYYEATSSIKHCGSNSHQTVAVVLGLIAAVAGAALISLLLYRYIARKRITRHTVSTISGSSTPYRRVNDQGLGMS